MLKKMLFILIFNFTINNAYSMTHKGLEQKIITAYVNKDIKKVPLLEEELLSLFRIGEKELPFLSFFLLKATLEHSEPHLRAFVKFHETQQVKMSLRKAIRLKDGEVLSQYATLEEENSSFILLPQKVSHCEKYLNGEKKNSIFIEVASGTPAYLSLFCDKEKKPLLFEIFIPFDKKIIVPQIGKF